MNTLWLIGIVLVYVISIVYITRSQKLKAAKSRQKLTQQYERERALEQANVEEAAQALATAQARVQTLERTLALEQAKASEAAQALVLEQANVQESAQSLKLAQTNVQELEQALTLVQSRLQESAQALTLEQARAQELDQSLALAQADVEESGQALALKQARVQELEQTLQQQAAANQTQPDPVTNDYQDLAVALSEAKQAIAQMTSELMDKDSHIQSLSQQLTDAHAQERGLQSQLDDKITELRQERDAFYDELETKEKEVESTKSNNRELSRQLANAQQELVQLKFSSNHHLNPPADAQSSQGSEHGDDTRSLAQTLLERLEGETMKRSLATRLSEAFQHLEFLRNSVDEILIVSNDLEKFTSLVGTLSALNDGNLGVLKNHRKVNATKRKWSECRVPHIDLLRIYFQKLSQGKHYQILVASKGDSKTQAQDFEWLKQHTIA